MARNFKRSPLALAVLTLLHESPMHPYKMQRLIKDRGKEQVINVEQRASLYQTINQLLKAELITFWETAREEGFPERTVYKLTEKGHATALDWMREMLASPANEYPEFPAAVSLLPLLPAAEVLTQLEARATRLAERLAALEAEMQAEAASLPRLFLLESEYTRAVLQAELVWVRSVVDDLRNGTLAWTQDWERPDGMPGE